MKIREAPEEPFTVANQIQRTLLTSWINILLVCVPAGVVLSNVRGGAPETFTLNYIAQIPLWFLCDYSLEELEKYIGVTATDILDIFTTNTVQIISSVLLLLDGKVDLLQTSLIGGILSNILVLLGLSISFGGATNIHQRQQHFNRTGAQGSSSLLSIAATSLLIPTAAKMLDQTSNENLVRQSRGGSVVLLFVYFTYSICQMWTHKFEYGLSGKSNVTASGMQSAIASGVSIGGQPFGDMASPRTLGIPSPTRKTAASPRLLSPRPLSTQSEAAAPRVDQDDNQILGPQLDLPVAAALFAASIVLLYFCIDATVDSISALTEQTSLTDTFVGLILLPIPNCDFAPISLAVDDQLEQTMKYTVGRSIQTALLVEPAVVLLAWGLRIPDVTLAFDGFEVVSLFTTILLLNFLVVDAKVHWVHGILLLADWVLIGIAAYFVHPQID
ncbi:putative calcium proton exchanger [Diaporthe ampelina]|uniref:Putative calcium proton exchanger n=1 Tax=Diaporthe ampelina TaxID=1214573 RepID=A0A0G2FUD9_9PEZI|nr:putative calcium proton exchanger [Diaporthe ampelina]